MNESLTAQEREVLLKLETGDYILKFSQIYRVEHMTLFPIGASIGSLADDLRNKGYIERRIVNVNGVQFKADVITNCGRKRLMQR